MDQITVSDIPLPGEEFSFKTDSQATDDASNADLKPEPVAEEVPLQEVQELPCTIETPELNNQPVEITTETIESSSEIQTIVTEVDNQITIDTEVKLETVAIENETENIPSELLQDVSEAEVDCVASDVISETVEELQMEVERVVSEEAEPLNNTQAEEQKQEEQVVAVEQPTEVEAPEATVPEEDNQQITEESVPVVEEPPTPAIEEEIIEKNIKNEEVSSPKPAKKATRTNSTIEAIKNDWTDSLTIEEIDEETEDKMNEASPPKATSEPIVTEPDNKPENETAEPELETVDNNLATITEIVDSKPETITETVTTNNSVETTEGVTEVLVLETVNEEIVASVDENVTIEIIDNTQQPTDNNKTDEQQQEHVKEEEKETTVYIVEEIANNNTPTPTTTTVVEEIVEKIEKPKPKRASQRLKDDKLQIPCHVLGRNVDNPTEDLISNGRTPPKPRLGVKVPYRFLTSQIVSKEEIADELLELTSKRNPAPDPPAGGDIFFASKLTQRLASKIALNANKQQTKRDEATSGIPTEAMNASTTTNSASGSQTNKNSIADNSDLLAILEGDVDVDWTKEVRSTKQVSGGKTNEEVLTETKVLNVMTSGPTADVSKEVIGAGGRKLDPETERQLALKQLREMPLKKDGRGRPRKHHHLYESKSYQKQYLEDLAKKKDVVTKSPTTPKLPVKKETEVVAAVQSPTKPAVKQETTNENIKQAVTKLAKKIKDNENVNVQDDKTKSVEVENDLNLNPKRVTKTYSRKEAVLDVPAELEYIVNELEPEQQQPQQQQQQPQPDNNTPRPDTKQKKQTSETTPTKQTPSPVKKTKRSAADINKPEVTLVSKRARIIKRKVIWDPAEVPKTRVLNAIRKAQALELKARKKQQQSEEEDDGDDEDEEDEEDEKPKEKPNMEQRQLRKNKILPRPVLTKVQKKKLFMKRQLRSLKGKLIRSSNGELKSTLTLRQKKKQQVVLAANKPKKTELDRLLGDEGAVNMLYSVRQKGKKATPQKTITQKELLNRKKVIKDVITQSSNQEDTPKALRKKESPSLPAIQIPPRKKSRDSVRSSLQSPPPSPSYFHAKGAEASRIIRRHSSSFSSDCSSPRRLSVDQQQQQQQQQPEENGSVRVLRRNKTIIIQPQPQQQQQQQQQPEEKQIKTAKKNDATTIKTEKDSKLSVTEKRKLNAEMSKNFDKMPKKRTRSSKGEDEEVKEDVNKTKTSKKSDKDEEERFINVQTEYKEILLKKSNNFYQIIMNSPANAKLKNVISLQMFRELGSVLTKLSKDESCKVLALTSTGKSFCRGLDFSNLIQTTAEKRSAAAQEMSKALKDFILTLATYPKPLMASLHGSASLLGCTMLPYFDVVLCSDAATLSADYTRVAHCPEGAPGAALRPRLARDLLLLGRRLTARDALEEGVVTHVEKGEKLEEVMVEVGTELCGKSQQCLTATKCLLRQPLLSKLEEALELEAKLLVEHWVNPECQQTFKKLLQEEELW